MTQGGEDRLRGGVTVRRERAGKQSARRDVSEGSCHQDGAVEQVVDGGPARAQPVRVPLGSIDELVGDLDGTTLASRSHGARRRRAQSPMSAGTDSNDATTSVIIHACTHTHRRAQHRATITPKSDAVAREHTVTLKHVRNTAQNRLVSGG